MPPVQTPARPRALEDDELPPHELGVEDVQAAGRAFELVRAADGVEVLPFVAAGEAAEGLEGCVGHGEEERRGLWDGEEEGLGLLLCLVGANKGYAFACLLMRDAPVFRHINETKAIISQHARCVSECASRRQ